VAIQPKIFRKQQNRKMKIKVFIFIAFIFSLSIFSQTTNEKYLKADNFLKENNISEAYKIYKEIKPQIQKNDTLYKYVVWYYVGVTTELEKTFRLKEDFNNSLNYGLEALSLIQENKEFFDQAFSEKEPWMTKNIIVSYFGLGKIEEAKKYKEILYKNYKEKTLPKGIDGYFNYDFYKLKDKNIWGYEWYPELPDDRFSSSFTKIVYYVYSTNPDGTDKDQLFRFHVLMYHQDGKNTKFDYLLERQIETDEATISGSYYQYTYKKDIDYKKLKENITEIITKEIEPSSKRTISKKK
jgi:hypothetical protein